jgi:hypothetical protein
MLCYYLNFGMAGLLSSAFDCVQAYGSALIAVFLYLALAKAKVNEIFGPEEKS